MLRAFNQWLEMLAERAVMVNFLRRALSADLARMLSLWVETVASARRDNARLSRYGAKFLRVSVTLTLTLTPNQG
jgi:hypothetical protein